MFHKAWGLNGSVIPKCGTEGVQCQCAMRQFIQSHVICMQLYFAQI